LSPDTTTWGWTVFHLPSTPGQLRTVQSTSDGQDILESDCWEANRLFPAPIIKAGILEAVIPRRCPAELRRAPKPCLHERSFDRPGRKNLGGFFLYGKLDAFYSSLGRILRLFLHPWLIGVQSAGDEFYQTTESPSRTETFRVFCASCEERRKMLVTVRKPDGP